MVLSLVDGHRSQLRDSDSFQIILNILAQGQPFVMERAGIFVGAGAPPNGAFLENIACSQTPHHFPQSDLIRMANQFITPSGSAQGLNHFTAGQLVHDL